MHELEFFYLFLKFARLIEIGLHLFGLDRVRMDAVQDQQLCGLDGHIALAGVEKEEFVPGDLQQETLIVESQFAKEGNVARPFDGAEEETGGELAGIVHGHVARVLIG